MFWWSFDRDISYNYQFKLSVLIPCNQVFIYLLLKGSQTCHSVLLCCHKPQPARVVLVSRFTFCVINISLTLSQGFPRQCSYTICILFTFIKLSLWKNPSSYVFTFIIQAFSRQTLNCYYIY